MFERLEERRKTRARATALMVAVGACAIIAIARLITCHMAAQVDERHAEYVAETKEQQRPRTKTVAGISLQLPGATGIEDTQSYRRGRIVGGVPFEYSIEWFEGSSANPADREKALRSLIERTGDTHAVVPSGTPIEIGDLKAYEYALTWTDALHQKRSQLVTFLDCDGRYFTFSVSANDRAGNNALLQSVRCTPDPTVHSSTARFSVVVDAEDGWKRIDSPDELELVGPRDIHLHAKMFSTRQGSVYDVIQNAAQRIQLRPHPTTRNDKVFVTGWLPGERADGPGLEVAILGFRCPWGDVATITIIGTPPLDPGILLADTGRCLEADDVMPHYEH